MSIEYFIYLFFYVVIAAIIVHTMIGYIVRILDSQNLTKNEF